MEGEGLCRINYVSPEWMIMKIAKIIGKPWIGLLMISAMACNAPEAEQREEERITALNTRVQDAPEEPFTQEGRASYYARSLQGRPMANGQPYRPSELTAAHRRLPLGTKVEVLNKENDNSVVVEITDRGPYVGNRIIDLSRAAAEELDFITDGLTQVQITVVEPAEGYSASNPMGTEL
jgi:rare lipoprotein A